MTMTLAKRKPTKLKATPHGKPRSGSVASRIVSRLTDFTKALESGATISEKFTVRTIRLNLQPTAYDTASVRKTRKLLNLSQPLFAKFLGVAVQTVRAWEQGDNVPSDMAARFLDEINANPTYWQRRLRAATECQQD
jgi:putative transcriptional regulator